jgi:hypothetical protein
MRNNLSPVFPQSEQGGVWQFPGSDKAFICAAAPLKKKLSIIPGIVLICFVKFFNYYA